MKTRMHRGLLHGALPLLGLTALIAAGCGSTTTQAPPSAAPSPSTSASTGSTSSTTPAPIKELAQADFATTLKATGAKYIVASAFAPG